MKIQLKIFSVLAAALAVVFFSASVSLPFSNPGELANCRAVESGLRFECDPVSNLAVVNSGVIPVTGLGLPSFTNSLRSVNDLELVMPATSLRSLNEVALGAGGLSLSDFALTLPVVPVVGLSDFALSSAGLENLSLSDFAISAVGLENLSLSDFALSQAGSDEGMKELTSMEDAYTSGMYGGY